MKVHRTGHVRDTDDEHGTVGNRPAAEDASGNRLCQTRAARAGSRCGERPAERFGIDSPARPRRGQLRGR